MASAKGTEEIGIQAAVLIIFAAVLFLIFLAFYNAETTVKMVNTFIDRIQKFNWRAPEMLLIFAVAILALVILLFLKGFSKAFERRI